ncbi:hypothetical protein DFS34DRAFT_639705 [Phlyctochytrium arcticum]|nr:hypothetical protein DFS34DRAFT_639705 [Phlyctochytrium arcticum]
MLGQILSVASSPGPRRMSFLRRPKCSIVLGTSPVLLPPDTSDMQFLASQPAGLSMLLNEEFASFVDPPPVLVHGTAHVDIQLGGKVNRVEVGLLGIEREFHPSNALVEKVLVRETSVLWRAPKTGTKNRGLPVGHHEFPFCIPLDSDLPPSCRVPFGEVTYLISVMVFRDFRPTIVMEQVLRVQRGFPVRPNRPISPDGDVQSSSSSTLKRLTRKLSRSSFSKSGFGNFSSSFGTPPIDSPSASARSLDTKSDNYLKRLNDVFAGPTSNNEFFYRITVPHPILRQDGHAPINIQISSQLEKASSISIIQSNLIESRAFSLPSMFPISLAGCYGFPAVEKTDLCKPVKFKLGESQAQQPTLDMPFVLEVGNASPSFNTGTLDIKHYVRVVLEYLPSTATHPSPAPSKWSLPFSRRSGSPKPVKLVIEVPVTVRDTMEKAAPPSYDVMLLRSATLN